MSATMDYLNRAVEYVPEMPRRRAPGRKDAISTTSLCPESSGNQMRSIGVPKRPTIANLAVVFPTTRSVMAAEKSGAVTSGTAKQLITYHLARGGDLPLRVAENGCLSVYGTPGRRGAPITLPAAQWVEVLRNATSILAFIAENPSLAGRVANRSQRRPRSVYYLIEWSQESQDWRQVDKCQTRGGLSMAMAILRNRNPRVRGSGVAIVPGCERAEAMARVPVL